jgi:hypothetical protein
MTVVSAKKATAVTLEVKAETAVRSALLVKHEQGLVLAVATRVLLESTPT